MLILIHMRFVLYNYHLALEFLAGILVLNLIQLIYSYLLFCSAALC